jgi:hypothetical protein
MNSNRLGSVLRKNPYIMNAAAFSTFTPMALGAISTLKSYHNNSWGSRTEREDWGRCNRQDKYSRD